VALVLCALTASGGARAAGFAIMEAGSKATALGGAFVAQADDPSSMFYNPAGNATNDKFTIMIGDTLIPFSQKLEGADPFPGSGYNVQEKKQIFFPPNFYIVAPVAKGFNLSLGAWFPYGLSTAWEDPDSFRGRFLSQRVDLRTYSLSLQASVAVTDWLSVGAGPELRIGDVKLQRNVPLFNPFNNRFVDAAHADIVGDGFQNTVTWAAGIQIKPCPRLRLGITYHAKSNIDYTGFATFYSLDTGNPQLNGAFAAQVPVNVPVPASVRIQYPSLTMFGVSYDICPQLRIEVDGNYTTWDVFDATTLKFDAVNGKKIPDTVLPHHWDNAWTIRTGLNYQATPSLNVGIGYVYDQTPQPDEDVSPLLPDASRNGYSIGAGLKFGSSTLEVSNLFLFFHDRNTNGHQQDNFNGTYKTFADLFVLNFRHSF
jgi:long-chain fatty acid transport protein